MLHHMILSNETLVADLTNVWLCASVQAHVPSQIRFVIELFDALATLEGLVSIVLGHVFGMRLIAWKTLATSLALERLFAAVECFIVLR